MKAILWGEFKIVLEENQLTIQSSTVNKAARSCEIAAIANEGVVSDNLELDTAPGLVDASCKTDDETSPCGIVDVELTNGSGSLLQFVFSVPQLVEFFRQARLTIENDEVRPGALTWAFSSLLGTLESGKKRCFVPEDIQAFLAKWTSEWTSELMVSPAALFKLLLNGLDAGLSTDDETPTESTIVRSVCARTATTLLCPCCGDSSSELAPLALLTLPLPPEKDRVIEVFFKPLDPATPIQRLKLAVAKAATVQQLCDALESQLPGISNSRLIVAERFNRRLSRVLERSCQVSKIFGNQEIFIFELAADATEASSLVVTLSLKSLGASIRFGQPLCLLIQREGLTRAGLQRSIVSSLQPYLVEPNSLDGRDDLELHDDKGRLVTDEAFDELKAQPIISLTAAFNHKLYKGESKIVDHRSWRLELAGLNEFSLSECLDAFFERQQQSPAVNCSACDDHKLTKKVKLARLPPVLVFELDRFADPIGKRSTRVAFPLKELDMAKYVTDEQRASTESAKYDLVAVLNHHGKGSNITYSTSTRRNGANCWHRFLASGAVFKEQEQDVCSRSAYMLLYVHQETQPTPDAEVDENNNVVVSAKRKSSEFEPTRPSKRARSSSV